MFLCSTVAIFFKTPAPFRGLNESLKKENVWSLLYEQAACEGTQNANRLKHQLISKINLFFRDLSRTIVMIYEFRSNVESCRHSFQGVFRM
jgi:hypothetical protein